MVHVNFHMISCRFNEKCAGLIPIRWTHIITASHPNKTSYVPVSGHGLNEFWVLICRFHVKLTYLTSLGHGSPHLSLIKMTGKKMKAWPKLITAFFGNRKRWKSAPAHVGAPTRINFRCCNIEMGQAQVTFAQHNLLAWLTHAFWSTWWRHSRKGDQLPQYPLIFDSLTGRPLL